MEEAKANEDLSFFDALKKGFSEIGETFSNFLKAPRALWGINVSYFLEGWAYFGVLTILGIYLSSEVGLWDLHAGWVLSFFTGGITLSMLFLGGVADKIGVRKALLISIFALVLGRLLLAFSGTFFEYRLGLGSGMFFCVIAGLVMVIIGYGMYQPASYAGVRHFTTKKTSAMGFAMIYALMNLGAFVSGIVSPHVRGKWGMVGVFWLYVLITILAFLSVLIILTKKTEEEAMEIARKDAGEEKEVKEEEPKEQNSETKKAKKDIYTLLFSIGLIGSLVAIAVIYFATPLSREEKVIREYQEALKELGRNLDDAVSKGDKEKITPDKEKQIVAKVENSIKDCLNIIKNCTAKVSPPEGKDLWVDKSAYFIMKQFLVSEELWISSLPSGADLWFHPYLPKDIYKTLKKKLRASSVMLMALAYGLVGNVDENVVTHLRLRLKKSSEKIIPMEKGEVLETVLMARLKASEMLKKLSVKLDNLRGMVSKDVAGNLSELLIRVFESYINFVDAVSSYLDKNKLMGVGRNILMKKLIYDSIILQGIVGIMGRATIEDKDFKKRPTLFKYIKTVFEKRKACAKEFLKDFPSAKKNIKESWFSRFAKKYLVFLVLALFFAIALIKRILTLKPDHPFHNLRFTYFIFILIPVQTLFAHNWLTLPYYLNRAFGGTWVSENYEFFSNINPILIFFLTPTIAALTQRANVYKMMILGTAVMSLPTFFLVFPPTTVTLLTYIFLMSVGEAMWQPRFLQFVAEIAPKGKTGIYMGIAQFPWFLTKVVTGLYSGALLEAYCPVVGPQNPQTLWLINACIAVTSTIGLIVAKKWILSGKMSME